MRPALLCLLLAALSWPALTQQDQSQTAPTTAPPPSSQVPAQPSTPTGTQQAPATEAPPFSAQGPEKKASKRKASKKTRKKHKKAKAPKPPATTADAGPRRIVVRRGGTSETGGQLEPGVPQTEADHQRQATERILQSTDGSLKNIAQRKLTPDQQDMVRQINSYMEQSHSAIKEGDLGRARSLADKARMLCDALARQ
jgi:cytoskeletal protein RodZ